MLGVLAGPSSTGSSIQVDLCSTANRHAPDGQRKQVGRGAWSHQPRAAVRSWMWLNNAALLSWGVQDRPDVLASSMHKPSQPIANSAPQGPSSHVPEIVLTCQHMRDTENSSSSSSSTAPERGSRRQCADRPGSCRPRILETRSQGLLSACLADLSQDM